MSTPKHVQKAIASASGPLGGRCYVNAQAANEWLTRKFSLFTDDNEQELDGQKLNFCWKLQRWYLVFD